MLNGLFLFYVSVIKIEKRLIDLATHVLEVWRGYTDEGAFIFAETDGEPHNTITPIARKAGDMFELDLTLETTLQQMSILLVYTIRMQSIIISRKRILV